MRKLLIITAAIIMCATVPAASEMTDSAVLSYIIQGVQSGKTKSQIGQELLEKGVTAEQARRIMNKFENNHEEMDEPVLKRNMSATTDRQRSIDTLNKKDMTDILVPEDTVSVEKEVKIFGHDFFNNKKLSFEPNDNMATPAGYILGPGDEIIIDVWGINEASISQTITPEGLVFISQVGPVQLSGLSIEKATDKIRSVLSSKYSLTGEYPESQVSVTLGKVRSITVNVLGEVNSPGTYRLSALTSVFNALYRAGGISPNGTLRNIQVFRSGRLIANSDLYDFIFHGKSSNNISLCDGDLIIVPIYHALVEMHGGLKRPMIYEAKEGETLDKLIEYAGGFAVHAYSEVLTVQRHASDNMKVFTVKNTDCSSFKLNDKDVVTVHSNNRDDIFDNRVIINGMVVRPGAYAIGGEIATVRQLVEHAGGLLDDAFTSRAQLLREKPDRTKEIKAISIGAIMDGSVPDVLLHKNDILIISNSRDINVIGNIHINGYVNNPGTYYFADGMTIEDLILLAGGLSNGASLARVDVSRSIINGNSKSASDTIAMTYSLSINKDLVVDNNPSFTLQPNDIVSVRKSPSYVEPKRILVSGEINFPGEYTLVTNNDRLSDIYLKAGKSTPNAFIAGSMLKRRLSKEELNVRRNLSRLISSVNLSEDDSLKIANVRADSVYFMGINLDKALENPGSEYDVVLHDGDELIIPSMTNTVRIQGEVLYPNTVTYKKNASVSYYVNQAGGFSNVAKRSKVYVVHMNGNVSVGMRAKVEAGSEIIVPARQHRSRLSTGEWLAIGSTTATIAAMIATIVNTTK